MGHLDPIAYKYEADYHCPACTEERFGRGEDGFIAGQGAEGDFPEDSEGNPVGIVAPWDEWWSDLSECETLNCGDCLGEIDRVHREDCEENFGEGKCDWRKYDLEEV